MTFVEGAAAVRGSWVPKIASVLVLIALSVPVPAAARPPAPAEDTAAAPADWTPPLSTRGRWIVDANGDRFKLRSGNWHGASGTWNGSGSADDDANHHAGENSTASRSASTAPR